jgi:integrase
MAGTYRRRESGNWGVEVMVDSRRLSSTHPTKRLAEKWVAEQLNKEHAVYSHSLLEAVERYKEEVSVKKAGHETEKKRFAHLERTFPKLFAMKVDEIETAHIESFIAEREQSVKASTVNRELNLLSHVFQKAIKWKWATKSPTTRADRPADPPPRERRITSEEIAIMAQALGYSEDIEVTTKSHLVFIAFNLAIETAMRVGEICLLRESDMDIHRKVIKLRAETTKTRAGRSVPLSPAAIDLIKRVPANDTEEWLGITAKQIDALFRKYRNKTTIVNLHFHDTRHEAITRLSKKLDVLDLARMTGHRDINELLVYYNRSAEDIAGDLV